ncbi:MAG: MFS transporter [Chitinophagaceae bacterium]
MIARTQQLYRRAYQGLTPETWWLSLVMLVNRSGTMVVPFLTIYLTRPAMGYSIARAGTVMGLFGLGAVIGAYISGKLIDRIGFYPIQIFTLTGGGLLFILLGQMKSYPAICGVTFLLSLVNEAFRPANSAAIASYSKPENRTRSYALNRLAMNLGWAFGNAMGGWLAAINFQWLFWFDGITNLLAGIAMWLLLRPRSGDEHDHPDEAASSPTSVWKDRVYMQFIVLTLLFASCFFQLFTNLPAYYRNQLGFSERAIGLVGMINGLMIAVFEMVIVFSLEGRRLHTLYITGGALCCALAFAFLQYPSFTVGWAYLLIIVVTCGEILALPFMNSFWISRSGNHNRGQYAALYTMSWATAQTIGPVAAAYLAQWAGFPVLWSAVAMLFLISGVGFYRLSQQLRNATESEP